MGIYLTSIGAEEWFDEGEDADEEEDAGFGAVASGLNEELRRRGLPPYESVPPESDDLAFSEKLSPPMDGFVALCGAHLTREEEERLCGWSVLVPVSLDEEIHLPIGSAYTDETVIAGAPQVLALAQRLAWAIGLPPVLPVESPHLGLTRWLLDGSARETAAARPGPWADDLDAAFYVGLYLRAAQYSLRHGCPIVYS
ncbi:MULTISPECIES: hypothetical protein [unclassified Streptomyces]|uniref:hypothetical protein n=1 Tax=unclassified Streptomyces TaxID=2593676 RepID=UPI0036DFCEF0